MPASECKARAHRVGGVRGEWDHGSPRSWRPRRRHVVDDMPGITADSTEQCRAERVEEWQAHEVETGQRLDNAAVLDRVAIASAEWEIEPAEIRRVPAAPDHVGHLHHS